MKIFFIKRKELGKKNCMSHRFALAPPRPYQPRRCRPSLQMSFALRLVHIYRNILKYEHICKRGYGVYPHNPPLLSLGWVHPIPPQFKKFRLRHSYQS